MSKILVVDTSRARVSVGLFNAGEVQGISSEKSRHSAQEVLSLIDQILSISKVNLQDLDAIGVITGPGSFTGLRIGIGVGQGLGRSLEIPLLGISSLALLAFSASRHQDLPNWLVAEAARDQELYLAYYQVDSMQGCNLVGKEQVAAVDSLDLAGIQHQMRPGEKWAAVGSAWENNDQKEALLARTTPAAIYSIEPKIEDACILASIDLSLGKACPELLLPNYVKEELEYT